MNWKTLKLLAGASSIIIHQLQLSFISETATSRRKTPVNKWV